MRQGQDRIERIKHLPLGLVLEPPNSPGLVCDCTQLKSRVDEPLWISTWQFESLRCFGERHRYTNCCSLVATIERPGLVWLALVRGPWTDGPGVPSDVPSPSLVHSAWTVQESTHFQPEAKSEHVGIGLQTEG